MDNVEKQYLNLRTLTLGKDGRCARKEFRGDCFDLQEGEQRKLHYRITSFQTHVSYSCREPEVITVKWTVKVTPNADNHSLWIDGCTGVANWGPPACWTLPYSARYNYQPYEYIFHWSCLFLDLISLCLGSTEFQEPAWVCSITCHLWHCHRVKSISASCSQEAVPQLTSRTVECCRITIARFSFVVVLWSLRT